MSFSAEQGVGGPAPTRLRIILILALPFLLSLIPLGILHRMGREQVREQISHLEDAWLSRTASLQTRLRRAVLPEFWVAAWSRQVERSFRRSLAGVPASSRDPERLWEGLAKALREASVPGLGQGRLWGFVFTDPRLEALPLTRGGDGLEPTLGKYFARLFREIARGRMRRPNELATASWRNRIRAFFGPAFTMEFFAANQQGKTFPVLFRGSYSLMTWNLVLVEGRPVAGYLMILPVTRASRHLGLRLCLNHWAALAGRTRLAPVFATFPTPFRTRPSVWTIPALPRADRRTVGRFLAGRLRSPSAPKGEGEFRAAGERIRPEEIPDYFSSPSILAEILDQKLEPGPGLWGRVIALPERVGVIGMLVGPASISPEPGLALVAWLATLLTLSAWLLVGLGAVVFRRVPALGFGMQLALWMILLASIPVLLIAEGSLNQRRDLEENLLESARQRLARVVQAVEGHWAAGLGAFTNRFESITRRDGFAKTLQKLFLTGRSGVAFLADANRRLFPGSDEEGGLSIHGPGGFLLPADPARMPRGVSEGVLSFIYRQAALNLDRANPELATRFPASITVSVVDRLLQSFGNTDMVDAAGFDSRLSTLQWSEDRIYLILDKLRIEGQIWFIAGALWNPLPTFAWELRKRVGAWARQFSCDLAIFHRPGVRARRLAAALGPGSGLVSTPMSRQGRASRAGGPPEDGTRDLSRIFQALEGSSRFVVLDQEESLVHVHASSAVPGLTIVARTSLRQVKARLEQEMRSMAGRIGTVLLLMAFLGWTLIRWLIRPVELMTTTVERIGREELDFRLVVRRTDELGQTLVVLDEMTAWLREKSRLSWFVSPQVLKAISGGELRRAARGSRRRAVILVSDVREFTTLSETHPPEKVFGTLNRHLGEMTEAINHHGGVIDRFIGDAVQAVFYEEPGRSPVLAALAAAREMMDRHEAIQETRRTAGAFPYRIGIGIEQGEIVTGVVGDPRVRLDFSILGETIREAAALEGCSKQGTASRVMVSASVRQALELAGIRCQAVAGAAAAWEVVWPTDAPAFGTGPAVKASGFSPPKESITGEPGDLPASTGGEGLLKNLPPAPAGEGAPPVGTGVPEDSMERLDENAGGAAGRFLPLLLLGVFWLAIGFLARDGRQSLTEDWREKQRMLEEARLSRDLALIGSEFRPADEVAIDLGKTCRETLRRLSPEAPPPEVLDRLAGMLAKWKKRFPRMNWAVLEHLPEMKPGRIRPGDWPTRVHAVGGPSRIFPDEILEPMFAEAAAILDGVRQGPGCSWREDTFPGWMGGWVCTQEEFMEKCYHRFRQTRLQDREFGIFWAPIFRAGFEDSPAREGLPAVFLPRIGPFLWDNLVGHVVVWVPWGDLAPDQGFRSLVRNEARRGGDLAVLPSRGAGRGWMSRTFARAPALRAALGGGPERVPRESPSEGLTRPEWLLGRGSLLADARHPFLLARRGSTGGDGSPLIGRSLAVIEGAWILITILILAHLAIFGAFPGLSLRLRLVGGFLLLLLPSVVIGLHAIGRGLQERRVGVLIREKNRLGQRFRAIDAGLDVFGGWSLALTDAFTRIPSLVKVLDRAGRQQIPPDSPEVRLPLGEIWDLSFRAGLKSSQIFLAGKGDLNITHPKTLQSRGGDETFWKLITAQLMEVLGSINPRLKPPGRSGTDGRDLVFLAQMEDLNEFLLRLLPPEFFGDLTFSPRAFQKISLGIRENSVYRAFIDWEGHPSFSIQCLLARDSMQFHLFNLWDRILGGEGEGGSRFRVAERDQPLIYLFAPFFFPRLSTDEMFLSEVYSYASPKRGEALALARRADGEWWELAGRGEAREMLYANVGQRLHGFLILLTAPIGQIQEKEAVAAMYRVESLCLLIGATFLLALGVTRRILEPVLALSDAARQVMAGNFATRLPIGRDDEFGVLAVSFNQMAEGVQEGRLLRQFVSEAAVEAVRQGSDRKAAGAGERREGVVLFSGLAGFKKALGDRSPEDLILDLNQFLEENSRLIRGGGGEIDKFIGDRILAVFFPRFGENLAAPARRAIQTAIRMRRWLTERGSGIPGPLGVGIVTGTLLTGVLGAEAVRLEHTIIGDPVNLASRLADLAAGKADGGVLIDDSTREAAESWLSGADLAGLGEISVKGKKRQVRVFEVRGQPGSGE